MFNPFLGGEKQLSSHWRSLRENLSTDLSDTEQLRMVCDFWAMAPMVNQYLDYTSPLAWPNPWELMAEKRFDSSSIALGMEYTLLLGRDGRWTGDRLELDLICTTDRSIQTLVLIVDRKHLLNYAYRLVLPLADEVGGFDIQQRYRYVGKAHEMVEGNLSLLTGD